MPAIITSPSGKARRILCREVRECGHRPLLNWVCRKTFSIGNAFAAFHKWDGHLFKVPMRIEKTTTPAATVLRISGEIDLHTTPALRAELLACSAERIPCLLLDFTEVDYIDSGGLAALIEYSKETATFGGRFALFGVRPKVFAVFELVRLDKFFTIAPDESQAFARLGVASSGS
jgi:anti-sigma B factor antagonist